MSNDRNTHPKRFTSRRYCPIKYCIHSVGASSGSGIKFFRMPSDDLALREQWIKSMQNHIKFDIDIDKDKSQILICELHFDPESTNDTFKRRVLKKGTVPTIFPVERKCEKLPSPNGVPVLLDPLDDNHVSLPKQTMNTHGNRMKTRILLKCKQCINTGTLLSRATAKLYILEQKLKKRVKKSQLLQGKLQYTVAQLIPQRIVDASHNNQNYIPQMVAKRKTIEDDVHDKDDRYAENDYKSSNIVVTNTILREEVEQQIHADVPNILSSKPEAEHADDNHLPICEREQFTQYILSAISELSETNALHAIKAIQMFLHNWPGCIADE